MNSKTDRIEIAPELFAGDTFPPHGRFSAFSDGQLVCMEATGPFNAELMVAYSQVVSPLFLNVRARGLMVTLVEWHESMLMSPASVNLLAETVLYSDRTGMDSVAVAYAAAPGVEGRDLMLSVIARQVFAPTKCLFKTFEKRADAKAWLLTRLAETDSRPGA